jgi:hypothetical protein
MAATFGTSGVGAFQAQAAQRPSGMKELVRMEPKPAFWYKHHPSRWTFRNGEWVPFLLPFYADPGVANVDQHGNTETAEVSMRRRGWTLIPWEAEPGGYCIAYEGVAGPVHMSKWERPKIVAGQTRIDADEEGYWAFCKRLVRDGYIELPDPDFIHVQIERQEKKVDEWREKAPSSPWHREALAVEEALLEAMVIGKERLYNGEAMAMDAAVEEVEAVAKPKPRRGRA